MDVITVYECRLGLGLGSRTRNLMVRVRQDMVRVREVEFRGKDY